MSPNFVFVPAANVGDVVAVVVGGKLSDPGAGRHIEYSTDGLTFHDATIVGALTSGPITGVAYNGSVWVAVSNTVSYVSSDGKTWTQYATMPVPVGTGGASGWTNLKWNGTVFCTVSLNTCATSPDGVTWTRHTIDLGRSDLPYNRLGVGASTGTIPGVFFASQINTTQAQLCAYATSADNGATWSTTTRFTPDSSIQLVGGLDRFLFGTHPGNFQHSILNLVPPASLTQPSFAAPGSTYHGTFTPWVAGAFGVPGFVFINASRNVTTTSDGANFSEFQLLPFGVQVPIGLEYSTELGLFILIATQPGPNLTIYTNPNPAANAPWSIGPAVPTITTSNSTASIDCFLATRG